MPKSNTQREYDVVVIGAGPGGYVAALKAARKGLKVALVEAEALGGTCLNWGCIPTKALLKSAEIRELLDKVSVFGFSVGLVEMDFPTIVKRSRDAAKQLASGVQFLTKKAGVDVIYGFAVLKGKGCVQVQQSDGELSLIAKNIILASGATARSLPGLEPDGDQIWTSREAMTPASVPSSVLVLGAGAIGVEFASFYHSMGSDVTIIEAAPRILPVEDEEVSAFAEKEFKQRGIKIHTSHRFDVVSKGKQGVTGVITSSEGGTAQIKAEKVILAVGVEGNTKNIGLENTNATLENGFVKVNEWLETAEPGLYAIGDIAAAPRLAHKASHEAEICVGHIVNDAHIRPLEPLYVPGCTYCSPQIASIGYTEEAAKAAGYDLAVGRFPFSANGKAISAGDAHGFVKVIFNADTKELLGAHMIGPEVSEMIHGFSIAITIGAEWDDLKHVIFPHPSLSEAMHEAVLDAFGSAVHI